MDEEKLIINQIRNVEYSGISDLDKLILLGEIKERIFQSITKMEDAEKELINTIATVKKSAIFK